MSLYLYNLLILLIPDISNIRNFNHIPASFSLFIIKKKRITKKKHKNNRNILIIYLLFYSTTTFQVFYALFQYFDPRSYPLHIKMHRHCCYCCIFNKMMIKSLFEHEQQKQHGKVNRTVKQKLLLYFAGVCKNWF